LHCPSCGHENPEGARFCGGCGASLAREVACPSCGASNPAGQRFCNSCGAELGAAAASAPASPIADPRSLTPPHLAEKIRASGAKLEGERKQVTVLFADVMGSMELAERSDPEQWREVMERFFAILAEGVHRFEGTVDKFTGDGIMALFGAPIAHEDHARRACFAALHLRDDLTRYAAELRRERGLSFSVRMGLNSGEVVVGTIGEDLSLSYTAVGHTVGLAQRMEQLAEPGKAYLTEATARLVEGFFLLENLGEFGVKGASEPLRVFELAGVGAARTTLEAARTRGLSRFVGRDTEMAALEAALDRSQAGNGQIVGVVGDPGVGKSRLCHEFAERCRARGIPVYRAAGLAHARNVPLLPALQLMRAYFGIEERDSDRVAREKVAGRLLLLDEALGADLPIVFDFLGVPDPERPAQVNDPEARKRRLLALLKRLVHVQGEREPGINLIEDLHWLDPASDEMLVGLVDAVAGSRTLVVANFRPEYSAEWMRRAHYQQLPLVPLGAEALAELLADLLGSDPSLDGLAELVRGRTGGNPFFVEEVVQELVESGKLAGDPGGYRLAGEIEDVRVPPTVQAVLAARIDRLDEDAKTVLQAASVIGKEFAESVLSRVAEIEGDRLTASLRALREGEFVYEHQVYPEAVYAFKHPLTQEVAHGSLLSERRQRFAAAAARAIAELQPERADEQSALIAGHWEAAGEALEAARWHARAAAWAGYNAPVESLRHWQRVRELGDELPESDETAALALSSRLLTMEMGWRLGISDEKATELFEQGRAIAERRGEAHMLAMFHAIYATTSCIGGHVDRAVELNRETVRLADQTADPALRVAVCPGVSYALFIRGELAEALAEVETGIEIGQRDPGLGRGLGVTSPYAFCVMFRGGLLANMGRLDEAHRQLELGERVAREQGDREAEVWNQGNWAQLGYAVGEPELALAHARRGLELAEELGDVFSRSWSRYWLGLAHLGAGEWEAAIELIEESLGMTAEAGVGLDSEGFRMQDLARAYAGTGAGERALELAERALVLSHERGARPSVAAALAAKGVALMAIGSEAALEEAGPALEEASAICRQLGIQTFVAINTVKLAELAALRDDEEERQRRLREARDTFAALGADRRAAELEAELATLARR
jgi:class 3 adenylate cyclase/tetratricopeptide (TPR) repeat protein